MLIIGTATVNLALELSEKYANIELVPILDLRDLTPVWGYADPNAETYENPITSTGIVSPFG